MVSVSKYEDATAGALVGVAPPLLYLKSSSLYCIYRLIMTTERNVGDMTKAELCEEVTRLREEVKWLRAALERQRQEFQAVLESALERQRQEFQAVLEAALERQRQEILRYRMTEERKRFSTFSGSCRESLCLMPLHYGL